MKNQTQVEWYEEDYQFHIDSLRHNRDYEAYINATDMGERQYVAEMKYVKRDRQLCEMILTAIENRYLLRILKEPPPENNEENILAA